ncbi:hypothetical protein AALP_AA6G120000 [Arabis alpina]|uniref:Uncharacterized protein n=1 Tax=Arabis alpina TaxID=50452 RepID=A0A087GNP5_ARAAL|nr:hypothetical protein AALP_AA6G120000 [Arabis alpina]
METSNSVMNLLAKSQRPAFVKIGGKICVSFYFRKVLFSIQEWSFLFFVCLTSFFIDLSPHNTQDPNLFFFPEHHLEDRGKPIPLRVVGNVANNILQNTPMATGKAVRSPATSVDGSGKKQLTAF